MFDIGEKVVCVDADFSDEGYAPPELIEGGIYTVVGIGRDEADELGLFLDEVESLGYGGGYLAYRFRKLPTTNNDAIAYVGESA